MCVRVTTEGKYTFLIAILIACTAGCSAGGNEISKYDSSNDRMVYQTGTMTVTQGATRSFASVSSITMQVVASCDGKGCTPENASLIFSVEGTSDLTLSNRTLEINFDGEQKTWENRTSGSRRNSQVGRTEGRLMKVVMPVSDLTEIANASSLTGSLGEKSLNLSGSQSTLQSFISSVRKDRNES